MGRMRTAGEAGWHESRYNLWAPLPGTDKVAVANLYTGHVAELGPIERYLVSTVEDLGEDHPYLARLARLGVVCDFDERAALETMGRGYCAFPRSVSLTVCPTMGCNFDCPYCFEDHASGLMAEDVQDDVVALAGRMLDASRARLLSVTWYGGEPLLAPHVIESLSARLRAQADARGAEFEANIITNGYLLTAGVARMLGEAGVARTQVTVDGLGATHDATRRLAGGGATFERIVGNLSQPGLPFRVDVRHNVHAGNRHQVEDLRGLVGRIARESGNDLHYYPSPVMGSAAADARGTQVGLLSGADLADVALQKEACRSHVGQGHVCNAQGLWGVGVDPKGRLHKCWEAVDKPRLSFGTARRWDPARPLETADAPDLLTSFLDTACPVPDEECAECVWLPECTGGCPYRRLFGGGKQCVPYRCDPEAYVRMRRMRRAQAKDRTGSQSV